MSWSGVTDVMIRPFASCDDSAVDRGRRLVGTDRTAAGSKVSLDLVQRSSLRAKGDVGDWWITQVFGGRPFRQILGFDADEPGRPFKDTANSKIPGRTGVFPLVSWGWGRQQVENYLQMRFGVHWPKSYCTFCCFPSPWVPCPPTSSACAPTRRSPVRCCAWSTRR